MIKLLIIMFSFSFAYASSGGSAEVIPNLTFTWVGIAALIIFVIGYYLLQWREISYR